jgi:hypothetical protein
MDLRPLARAVTTATVALLVMLPSPAIASLGGDQPTVDADRSRSQSALLRIARSDTYTLHEMQSPTGVVVREYMTSNGKVFAVAWNGPWMPDLRQLLGPYFDRYQQDVQRRRQERRGRGPLTIENTDFIVQSGGHPRAFSGRAWLPGMMPAGVQLDSIR